MAMLPVQAPPEQGSVHEIRPRRAGSSSRGLAGRSDERLVSIAKEGDERAFEILFERHSPAIHRYCRSLLRSTQEAEDVKQEVFVLAISALRRGAEPNAFRPWLYRVAHNACMSHLRIRRPVLVADNGVLVGPAAAAEPVQHHREELRQLLDDIGKLPDVQRGALLLREMDGFSYEQVGEVLGLPLSTVRASIFRARRTLQGLAEARDADCEVIQSELCELVDRRGRRGRHITSHLSVCSNCRDFRDELRRRPTVLGAVSPVSPFGAGGLLLALKGKLLGGAAASGGAGTAVATAGGGAGVAKIAAVAVSSIAILASAGVEANRAIDHGRRDAAVTPRHATAARGPRAVRAGGARATVRHAAARTTISAPDTIRVGAPLAARPGHAVSSATGSRAHARVKEAPTKRRAAAATGAPRAAVPATGSTAPAAAATTTPAGGREHGSGESTSTTGRRHGSRESSHGSQPKGASNGTGADHAEHASPRSDSSDDVASNRPGTPGGADDSPRTPAPGHSDNAGPPAPPTDRAAGTPATPGSQGPPPSPSPSPAPVPAPTPDPPADPAPNPAPPQDPPADPPVGDAGTTGAATSADPAAVAVLPQP